VGSVGRTSSSVPARTRVDAAARASPAHDVGGHAVDSDRGEHEREYGEERDEDREKALRRER
jgi:hypothetical protein